MPESLGAFFNAHHVIAELQDIHRDIHRHWDRAITLHPVEPLPNERLTRLGVTQRHFVNDLDAISAFQLFANFADLTFEVQLLEELSLLITI